MEFSLELVIICIKSGEKKNTVSSLSPDFDFDSYEHTVLLSIKSIKSYGLSRYLTDTKVVWSTV